MRENTTPNFADRVFAARDYIRKALGDRKPTIGLVLGSGLGGYAEKLRDAVAVFYSAIPDFPMSWVPGHLGILRCGYVGDKCVLAMQGRVHAYEGWPLEKVVLPVRAMIALGAKTLIITNAAGGIKHNPGSLVIIQDHINLAGLNPLVGLNDDRLGPRFPDMTHAYDPRLREHARECMAKLGILPSMGVYAVMGGPSYETPAEVEAAKRLGADLLGMSTIPEVIAARHMGARCLGISCVTNRAAGISKTPLSHQEVEETAVRVRDKFAQLITLIITSMPDEGQKEAGE